MEILGRGLIATGFRRFEKRLDDALVFACGVPDSAEVDETAYRRELELLDSALARARTTDRRIVYFSGGGAIYGPFAGVRDESTPLHPSTRYGRHQAYAEARIRASGAKHVIARLGNLVGANQNPAQLVPGLVHQALRGQARILRDASRDVIAVDDAVRLMVELMETGAAHTTVVVARGTSTPVPELFHLIERLLGVRAQVDLVPSGERQTFSVTRLERHLGRSVEADLEDLESSLARYLPALAMRALPE